LPAKKAKHLEVEKSWAKFLSTQKPKIQNWMVFWNFWRIDES